MGCTFAAPCFATVPWNCAGKTLPVRTLSQCLRSPFWATCSCISRCFWARRGFQRQQVWLGCRAVLSLLFLSLCAIVSSPVGPCVSATCSTFRPPAWFDWLSKSSSVPWEGNTTEEHWGQRILPVLWFALSFGSQIDFSDNFGPTGGAKILGEENSKLSAIPPLPPGHLVPLPTPALKKVPAPCTLDRWKTISTRLSTTKAGTSPTVAVFHQLSQSYRVPKGGAAGYWAKG